MPGVRVSALPNLDTLLPLDGPGRVPLHTDIYSVRVLTEVVVLPSSVGWFGILDDLGAKKRPDLVNNQSELVM